MIQVDLGYLILGIFAGLLGANVQFWQKSLKEEMAQRTLQLNVIKDDLIAKKGIMQDITQIKSISPRERRNQIKIFVKGKIREQIRENRISWTLTLFFGIIAAILYLLVTPLDFDIGQEAVQFFIGAFSAGYAGETFVYNALKKDNPYQDLTFDDLKESIQ